jgi:hypothetical protein
VYEIKLYPLAGTGEMNKEPVGYVCMVAIIDSKLKNEKK